MPAYALALVSFSNISTTVELTSTDLDIFEWLREEVQQLVPSSKMKTDSTLDPFRVSFSGLKELKGKLTIGWLIMSRLCDKGWEPFAVDGHNYYFRKRL